MTDRECLRAFARHRCAESFRSLVERYLPLVYSSAYRQTSDEARAAEATRAVFLALAYRARRLPRKTVLAGWLFKLTRFACVKLAGRVKSSRRSRLSNPQEAVGATVKTVLWTQLAFQIDEGLDHLPPKQREAVLLKTLLDRRGTELAQILRISERRAGKRAGRGLEKLVKRLGKRGVAVTIPALALACATEGCGAPPEGLAAGIISSAEDSFAKKPPIDLVRRTLRAFAWAGWRCRLKRAAVCLLVFIAAAAMAGFGLKSVVRDSRFLAWFLEWSVRHQTTSVPGLAQAARPWPPSSIPEVRDQKSEVRNANAMAPVLEAASVRRASDFYQTTNIWLGHLMFSGEQWKLLGPRRVDPLPNFLQPDETVLLRNPKAHRSGLAGVLGYDFDWAHANLELGGVSLSNVAARFKGNGTYLSSLYGWKRSFKVDLRKFSKGQQFGGVEEINFTNLIDDRSYMSDALAYELFREAGVPAPRTAYAWLRVSVAGQWDEKPLGLYLLVENLGGAFAAERFGSKKTPIFKPVTYELFRDLGEDWPAYATIYDLKTKATAEQQRRVIDFARLVSHAGDEEFARRLGAFLDLDEFARFLAGLVLLSSYDSFLSDGQNFYLYLEPSSNKFGFIPWDLDQAWGSFPFIATAQERERASIWHPWVGRNRFLERVMAVEEFRLIYRARLEDFLTRLFVPGRLFERIDQLAQLIRSPIAAESSFRLERFDQAVSQKWLQRSQEADKAGPDRPVHQLKRFIEKRARSVRQQLDGTSKGMILQRGEPKKG